MKPKG